jgi:guanylate kinase
MVCICGKAASGKDTILKNVLEEYSDIFCRNLSTTTRSSRKGEVQGIDYDFITEQEMMNKLMNGDMLEVVEFNGNFYGTALDTLSKEKINISIYNPGGIELLLENTQINLLIFYIECDDKIRVLRYINREPNFDLQKFCDRMLIDEKEFNPLIEEIKDYEIFTKFNNDAAQNIYIITEEIVRISKDFFFEKIDKIKKK